MKIMITYDLEDVYIQKIKKMFPTVQITKVIEQEDILKTIGDMDIVLAGTFNAEIFAQAKKLRWIQSTSAGADRFLFPAFVKSNIVLTNASGIHPKQIAEHVLGIILVFTRRLNIFIRLQLQKKWRRTTCEELSGKVLGVVGFGSIGSEIGRKAKCFQMKVIATKKTPISKPAHVDELLPQTDLGGLLQKSDFVVLSLPLTSETYHIIGEKELKSMKKEAILINIGRGKLVDETALVKALKEGGIAGAGLDVFETEPLPINSELWSLENVVLTPHVAGSTPYYSERVVNIFIENLKRFTEGSPLINIVNKKEGY